MYPKAPIAFFSSFFLSLSLSPSVSFFSTHTKTHTIPEPLLLSLLLTITTGAVQESTRRITYRHLNRTDALLFSSLLFSPQICLFSLTSSDLKRRASGIFHTDIRAKGMPDGLSSPLSSPRSSPSSFLLLPTSSRPYRSPSTLLNRPTWPLLVTVVRFATDCAIRLPCLSGVAMVYHRATAPLRHCAVLVKNF